MKTFTVVATTISTFIGVLMFIDMRIDEKLDAKIDPLAFSVSQLRDQFAAYTELVNGGSDAGVHMRASRTWQPPTPTAR